MAHPRPEVSCDSSGFLLLRIKRPSSSGIGRSVFGRIGLACFLSIVRGEREADGAN